MGEAHPNYEDLALLEIISRMYARSWTGFLKFIYQGDRITFNLLSEIMLVIYVVLALILIKMTD